MKFWIKQNLIAVDQLFNTCIGGWADETLSARSYRENWCIQHLINFLFWNPLHCKQAYESEKERLQSPPEER